MSKKRFIYSLDDIPLFVDVPYFCDVFRLHPNTVLNYLKRGKIKGTKVGRCWRIPKSEIEKMYHEGGDYS